MRGSCMKRTAAVAVALAAAATIAGGALAKRPGGPGGPGGRDHLLGHIERGVERLDLTADTKQAVYAAIDEARTQRRALGDQIRAAQEQMKAALDAASPSLDAVLAQADSIGALETQAKKIELSAVVKVRSLLTDEQWKELQAQRGECSGRSWARSPADAGEPNTGQGA
jgi:Spy/CpxP family protein refolding chaperone